MEVACAMQPADDREEWDERGMTSWFSLKRRLHQHDGALASHAVHAAGSRDNKADQAIACIRRMKGESRCGKRRRPCAGQKQNMC